MIASSVPPNFWADAISTAIYLINIKPFSTVHGGIHLERLCGKMPDYSSLHLFGCVCYMLLVPHECTKLTAQSIECVFLGYSVEIRVIIVGIQSLIGYGRHGILSLMSPVLSIHVPPLMLLLHLWLTICLSYFSLMLLLLLCLFLAQLCRPLCLPLSLLQWF
jgi:hypothetical protein